MVLEPFQEPMTKDQIPQQMRPLFSQNGRFQGFLGSPCQKWEQKWNLSLSLFFFITPSTAECPAVFFFWLNSGCTFLAGKPQQSYCVLDALQQETQGLNSSYYQRCLLGSLWLRSRPPGFSTPTWPFFHLHNEQMVFANTLGAALQNHVLQPTATWTFEYPLVTLAWISYYSMGLKIDIFILPLQVLTTFYCDFPSASFSICFFIFSTTMSSLLMCWFSFFNAV